MAISLISGLIANQYPVDCITVAEPDADKLNLHQQTFGIHTHTDNNVAIANSDVIVLAVKPQILQDVCRQIAQVVQEKQPLIISIAAGIRSTDIDRWLGKERALVRCMPNTPALLQAGATGLYANEKVSPQQRNIADQILSAAGITLWVSEEPLLDAVTAVSGSGPAYFFLLIEAMQQAGQELGLDADTAQKLSLQTALGAARMATESDDDPTALRNKVTSKGGTTEAAINYFNNNGFQSLVSKALKSANDRATELANLLGKDQ